MWEGAETYYIQRPRQCPGTPVLCRSLGEICFSCWTSCFLLPLLISCAHLQVDLPRLTAKPFVLSCKETLSNLYRFNKEIYELREWRGVDWQSVANRGTKDHIISKDVPSSDRAQ